MGEKQTKTNAELFEMLAQAVRNMQPQPLSVPQLQLIRDAQPEPKRKTRSESNDPPREGMPEQLRAARSSAENTAGDPHG